MTPPTPKRDGSEFEEALATCTHPLVLGKIFWPAVKFYDKQIQMVESLRNSVETYVVAGNDLGKDFTSAFIALTFFLRPQLYFDSFYVSQIESLRSKFNPHPHTCRILTTSVSEKHLKVLWGEIGRFVTTSVVPLTQDKGGPLAMNYMDILWAREQSAKNPLSYLRGQVSAKSEGMAGHHAAYTLCIIDEASGSEDWVYEMQQGWAKRLLAFGNPNPCVNFFRKNIKAGNLTGSLHA